MTVHGLLPPALRADRSAAKRRAALRWLRDETWSTPEILGKVMGLRSRQGAHQTLSKLERDGYVSSTDLPIFKKTAQRIYGITPHGLAHAFDPDEPWAIRPTFEPSKLKLTTLQHEVDIQMARCAAECAGWSAWTPGARLGASRVGEKRPDAVAIDPNGQVVAIEIERTIKTTKRYEVLLSQYLQAAAKGRYSRVVWLCPTADLAERLRRIILAIQSVPVGSKRVPLEPRHYQLLSFLGYLQWPEGLKERV